MDEYFLGIKCNSHVIGNRLMVRAGRLSLLTGDLQSFGRPVSVILGYLYAGFKFVTDAPYLRMSVFITTKPYDGFLSEKCVKTRLSLCH